MDVCNKLKEKGWCLSEEGTEILVKYANSTDLKILSEKALEFDLKKIGCGALSSDLSKSKTDFIKGNVIVQITKLKNVSAPKSDQNSHKSPRLLKLTLTDGKNTFFALEMKLIPRLSLSTPPGTKLFLKGNSLKLMHNYVLLNSENTEVLGGIVTSLVEKWEVEKKLEKCTKGTKNVAGYPPWIPFDKNIIDGGETTNPENHKTTNLLNCADNKVQNDEFDSQLQQNIKQALIDNQKKPKKDFGGGKKTLVDMNVQRLMDKGFSQFEAENALKLCKHNFDKALKKLQFSHPVNQHSVKSEKFEKHTEVKDFKPNLGKISLSDFFEDLPLSSKKTIAVDSTSSSINTSARYGNTSEKVMNKTHDLYQNANSIDNYKSKAIHEKKSYHNINHQRDKNQYLNVNANAKQMNRNKSPDRNNTFRDRQSNKNVQNKEKVYGNKFQKNIREDNSFPEKKSFQQSGNKDFNHEISNLASSESEKVSKSTVSEFPKKICNTRIFRNNLNSNSHTETAGGNGFCDKFDVKDRKWRIGDRCIAKYWEDKKYYDAEITGLSDYTCVVRFLEYGNFEEVSKFDCLPVTQSRDQYSHRKQYNSSRNKLDNNVSNHQNKPLEKDQQRIDESEIVNKVKNLTIENRAKKNRFVPNIYVPPAQRK